MSWTVTRSPWMVAWARRATSGVHARDGGEAGEGVDRRQREAQRVAAGAGHCEAQRPPERETQHDERAEPPRHDEHRTRRLRQLDHVGDGAHGHVIPPTAMIETNR